MHELQEFLAGRPLQSGTLALIVLSLIVGAIITPLVTFVLRQLVRPCAWLLRVMYRKVAFKNPLNVSVRTYRAHLQKSFSTIDTPVGPQVEVPFDRAFVPLRLQAREREALDLLDFASSCRRCMILGGPGTGKTTLMKGLVLATLRNPHAPDALPVFVTLRKLAAKSQTIEEAMAASLDEHGFPEATQFLQGAFESGRLLIVLDGLDEVGTQRDFVVSEINNFCDRDAGLPRQNSVFVTCREAGYQREDLGNAIREVARIEPFSSRHMRDFLRAWPAYRGRNVLGLYRQIQQDPHARDLCRNPLLLTLLAGLYLESPSFELPTSRNAFFRVALAELLSNRSARRNIKSQYSENVKLSVLQRASLHQLFRAEKNVDPELLTPAIFSRCASEVDKKIDAVALLDELELDGAVRSAGTGAYTFAHRTFQEFLSAKEAARTLTSEQVLAASQSRPELAEVLSFYCGMIENLPELERVLKSLSERLSVRVAARALLFSSDGVSSDLVESLSAHLAKGMGNSTSERADFELLASLAQRRGASFEPARLGFERAIADLVAASSSSDSAVSVEAALAASPETALQVVPAVLASTKDAYKRAAVRVLLGIDTDDSLDQLVRLVESADAIVRSEAAQCLVVISRSRSDELRQRADLVGPSNVHPSAWPFPQYFPRDLALGIAANLDPDSGESPFHGAARAIRSLKLDDSTSKKFLRHWRMISYHVSVFCGLLRFNQYWGEVLGIGAIVVCAVMPLLSVPARLAHYSIIIGVSPLRVEVCSVKEKQVIWKAAALAYQNLQRKYEPQAIPPPRNALVTFRRRVLARLGVKLEMPPAVPKEFEISILDLRRLANEDWPSIPDGEIPSLLELTKQSGHPMTEETAKRISRIEGRRIAIGTSIVLDVARFFFLGASVVYWRILRRHQRAERAFDLRSSSKTLRGALRGLIGTAPGRVFIMSFFVGLYLWMSIPSSINGVLWFLVFGSALTAVLPFLLLRVGSRQHLFFSAAIEALVDPRRVGEQEEAADAEAELAEGQL